MRPLCFAAALAAVSLAAGAASATNFAFTFSAPTSDFGVSSAKGMLTADAQGDGSYLVTGVSGEWNSQVITGVSDFDGADNLIFPIENPLLDGNGFSFTVAGRGSDFSGDVNIYDYGQTTDDPNAVYTDSDPDTGLNGTFSLTEVAEVSAAPEPGTWALMMLGVGAIGAMLGHRKRDRRPQAETRRHRLSVDRPIPKLDGTAPGVFVSAQAPLSVRP